MPESDSPVASLGGVSTARMYDAAQGGKQNFSADRAAMRHLTGRLRADAAASLVAHHQHVHRVVRHLAGRGLAQFVLYGTGLPSTGQAHETIHAVAPAARVVYAEQDPYMLAHAHATTGKAGDRVRIVPCDLRRPADVLDDPIVRTFVDWAEPVAVGVLAVHEIPVADASWVARLRRVMAAGSRLWLTALSLDAYDRRTRAAAVVMCRALGLDLHFRTRDQVLALFEGTELVEPGLVWAPRWRPDGIGVDLPPERTAWLCGVARVG
ncbi:S-adenosyl methyltransferase [Nonomuraea jiangxiensis]|uniref:S-adenosyl methyltransferase n=1 Tax=Nonomuraea jiangxiensis TaxID=633440 RepID=A0A1G9DK26_9ACTN|nr:S-adenosyl methyltransferase [Nonomuraea jiangxiensis]